jgi:spore maturation protein CgeB
MAQNQNTYRIAIVLSRGIAAPHIMCGLAAGFESLGHCVQFADIQNVPHAELNDTMAATRNELVAFKPHFAAFYNSGGLLINPPGIPETGKGRHLFEALQIPCAALFFDSPLLPVFMQDISILHASPLYNLFVWDRRYIEILKTRFGDAHYLPLGANPDVFHPRVPDPEHAADVAFIGSVADNPDFDAQRSAQGWPAPLISLAGQIFSTWKTSGDTDIEAILHTMLDRMQPQLADALRRFVQNAQQYTMFQQSILAQIAHHQRWEAIRALPPARVNVYGGPGWNDLGLDHVSANPPVDYHTQTPVVYSSAKINLNISSIQLATALNQRAFDVPACGGFLLTDFREDAATLFTPGQDIAVYNSLDDLKDKTTYYLEHEDERLAMAARARERVLREHTWAHRAQSIIQALKSKTLIP